jgi:hypothetical protein
VTGALCGLAAGKAGEFQPLVELGEPIPSLVNFPELTDTDIPHVYSQKKSLSFSINADDSPKMKVTSPGRLSETYC